MKKAVSFLFAIAMVLSIAFFAEATSSTGNNPFVGKAQVTVKKKRRPGAIRSAYRGGKWVTKKTWNGTKWVSRKVWQGTKWTGKKSWKTGRKVVSRSKKVIY